ncbi:MAG: NUDIX domain-containing protein [Candidatus Moranbacteria bacterium]|nr:NUDIX domain-containing protein [Candidatus Moranbacteria bacterium]
MEPIEVFKFNPLNGNKLVGKSENLLVDEKTGFHYYISPKPTVNVLIVNDNQEILMTKRGIDPGKDNWDLPGGFVDIGETLEEAVKREINEELRGEVKKIEYFGSFLNRYEYCGVNYHIVDVSFLVKLKTLRGLKPKDDVAGFKFFKLDKIPFDRISFCSIREVLKQYLKRNGF